MHHKYGYRVIAQLLHPDSGRYLPPQLAALAAPAPKAYSAEAMQRVQHDVVPEAREQPAAAAASNGAAESDDDDEEGGAGGARPTSGPLGGSKKDPQVRRRELLSGGGAGSLAAALVALCAEQAPALIRSQHGSDVLVEVCRGGEGGLLIECLEDGAAALAPVHDALVAAAAGGSDDAGASGDEGEEGGSAAAAEPVLSHFFGSRALRRLLLASGDGGAAGTAAAAFAAKLWRGALAGQCAQWVDTHAAKVLAALLHCGDAGVAKAARAELAPLVPGGLDEWADRLTAKQPAAADKQPKKRPAKQPAAKQPAAKQQQQQKGKKK